LDKTTGVEYRCSLNTSDDPSLLLVIDCHILGKVDIEEEKQGQALMLDIVSDPDVNLQFNALKGAVSPYKKPAADALDTCSAQVSNILFNKEAVMTPYAAYAHNSSLHATDTEIYRLWKDAADSTELNATVEVSIVNFTELLRERKEVFMEGVEDSGPMATAEA